MPQRSRHDMQGPPTETLAAGAAGLIFLLVGWSHGGQFGERLGLVGLVIIAGAALAFLVRLAVWLRHREPPAR